MNTTLRFQLVLGICLGFSLFVPASGRSQEPTAPPNVAVRFDPLPVTPAHLPVVTCRVTNGGKEPFRGDARIELPDGWACRQAERPLTVAPGETAELAFSVTKGVNREENRYPIGLTLRDGEKTYAVRREVPCATAPYFKPQIDGRRDDWNDALPVSFAADGRAAEVRTYWNRRSLAVLVAVEEDQLSDDAGAPDAVQIALSSRGGGAPDLLATTADRHELLLMARDGEPVCLRLVEPGTPRSETPRAREPASLVPVEGAELKRWREGNTTCYECSIPLKSLAGIQAGEGRVFGFSVLVHDGDGRTLRDLGIAVGLKPGPIESAGWSRFVGDQIEGRLLCPSNGTWGMCSSKY